jgi:hypothetical protein
MPTQKIQFKDWLPDQPSILDAVSEANNVVPLAVGYGPFKSAVNYSASASENLTNVFSAKVNSDVTLFTGGNTKLFKLDTSNLSFEDVTRAAGAYTGTDRWQFMQFGTVVLAANNSQKIQAFDVSSSTDFADVAAAAPVSKYITAVRDFVVAANIGAGTYPSRVQWSDINDETDWTSGATSQSDYQDLPDGGNITSITGGEFGLVLLEKAIVRMSYVGSPLFFQFDTISRNVGCIEGGSVAQYSGTTYFLSDDGFYACNGQSVIGIGSEKVDRYFFRNANIGNISSISAAVDPERNLVMWNYVNISGGRSLIIYNFETQKWSEADTDVTYLSTLATTGTSLDAIDSAYNINAGSFVATKQYTIRSLGTKTGTYSRTGTTVTVTITAHGFSNGNVLAIDFTSGTALDGNYTITVTGANTFTLTTIASGSTSGNVEASTSFTNIGAVANTIGVLFTATGIGSGTGVAIDMAASTTALKTIDTLTTTLDDRLYAGGKFIFGGVRDDKIITFTGTYATATITTNDLEYGYNSVVTLIRPSVDNGSAYASIASRRMLNSEIYYSTPVLASSEDRCSVRSYGRYHRILITPTDADWHSAIGLDLDYSDQGTR